jgi:adenine-specific DNA-methyltransferase
MRYLGNKTRLLKDIEAFANKHQATGSTFFDCFAGTGVVGAHFKQLGYKVYSCDLLHSSYVSQVALIEVSSAPSFQGMFEHSDIRKAIQKKSFRSAVNDRLKSGGNEIMVKAVTVLEQLIEPEVSLISRNYAPSGHHKRRYFRDDHARKIDGCLLRLRDWLRAGVLEEREFYVLLQSVLEGSDRVANIAGVYAAYLKSWQSNTLRSLSFPTPQIVEGPVGKAYRGDVNERVKQVSCDVLYADPPYNTRQYAAYYHVREVMAELHKIDDLNKYEQSLYGKTGLRPYDDLKSEYCMKRKEQGRQRCEQAFATLIERARAKHIIISYNEEGIISRNAICEALARFSGVDRFDTQRNYERVCYRRFRSDANGHNGRQYKVLEGQDANKVDEWLFYARAKDARTKKKRLY